MILKILCSCFFAASLIAAESGPSRHEKPTGVGNYGIESIDSIEGAGLVKLHGTSVKDLQMQGSLLSRDAKIGSIDIQGEANFRDSIISGDVLITGAIQTHSSTFEKPVAICTKKALFTHSKVHSITVRQEPSYKGKQIVELKQGTISGPIHFESGKGEVHIDPSSRIDGKVTGGKVIRKSS